MRLHSALSFDRVFLSIREHASLNVYLQESNGIDIQDLYMIKGMFSMSALRSCF